MKPTSQQEAIWAAIEARESNLMLQARAGCGKTTTIVQGLDYISPDESALFLAFGREDRAALERKVRRPNTMKATTHSYGLAQIRNEFGYVEVDAKKAVKLAMKATRSKNIAYAAAKLADLLRSQLRSTSAEARRLAARYGIEFDGERELSEIVNVAQHVLTESAQQTDTVDHADMIWLPVELELPLTMYDRVFVDETQDLTPVQLELVRRTVKPSGRLIAVGDSRQAIYRWRGAHPSGMQMLSAISQARELPLSASFRCPQRVIAEAQKLVPDIVAVDGAAQGEVRRLTLEQAVREAEYGDVFVSRLNAPLVRITMELLRDGCAASMLGSSIGAGLAGLVYKMRAQSVTHLKSLLETWATRQAGEILRDDPEALDAAADVRDRASAIIAIAASCSNVREVADKIKRMFSDDGNFASRVTLASTHKAKGKEWDRVYVLRDTYMRRQTTEEANLLYVAITRAKKELVYVTE